MTEYRIHITISGPSIDDETAWEPFAARLDTDHEDLGPVLSFPPDGLTVTVSLPAATAADALGIATRRVLTAARSARLTAGYPITAEIELGDQIDDEPRSGSLTSTAGECEAQNYLYRRMDLFGGSGRMSRTGC